MTAKRAIIMTDDISPDEGFISFLVMHADWGRRSGALLRVQAVGYQFMNMDKRDVPELVEISKDPWLVRDTVAVQRFSGMDGIRSRTSGGHFPAFAWNWHKVRDADKTGLLPKSFHMQDTGGDWRICNPTDEPFIFSAEQGRQHPLLKKMLRNLFEIAEKCAPYCAKRLEDFPAGVPFRKGMIARYPERRDADPYAALPRRLYR